MPLMVFLGATYRFYANELRGKTPPDIDMLQVFVGVSGFLGSCVVFGLVMWGVLAPLHEETCAVAINASSNGTCPITDPKLQHDRDAVQVLTYVWIGYPVVSLISRFSIKTYGVPSKATKWMTYAQQSLFKDLSYAVLDIVAKAGLALYVSYRTTWL